MKGLHLIFVIAVAVMIIALPSCGDAPTELGWENSSDSQGEINDIIWADGDQVWSKSDGYATTQRTGSKEVQELNGMVECALDPDGTGPEDFTTAIMYIEETNSQSLSLNPGESSIYTIRAIGTAK